MILSAAAVAAVAALGVWTGLAATAVPTVDLGETVNDTVVVSTGTQDSGPSVEWRLHRDGDVSVIASLVSPSTLIPPDFPTAERARIAVELACDARLADLRMPSGVDLLEDGEEANCGPEPLDEGVPARQVFVMKVAAADLVEIRGHPLREWSTSTAGQTTARSPRMLFSTGGIVDPALPFNVVDPAPYSTLDAVLEVGPEDLLDLTVTPAGDVVESTSVMVQGDGEQRWVDSVTWSLTFAGLAHQFTLEEGLARWTDPSGQTTMQLLLLLSGALIGVAASVAVERLFSWAMHVRTASSADGEGLPLEADAPEQDV